MFEAENHKLYTMTANWNKLRSHLYAMIKEEDDSNLHYIIDVMWEDRVEWLNPTIGEKRLIMPHASIWWRWHGWSDDAALRYTPYLRDDSMTGRTRGSILHLMISSEPSLIFMQWLRIEIIISVIISIIIWDLSVVNRHEDKMTEPATPKQCDENKIRSRSSKMSLIDDDYPE